MKNVIIKINDVSEINTAKISVYDLKNRYIDNEGNIFGLKFNQMTKKVEIIKLMRTHSSQVHLLNKQIIQKKLDESTKETDESDLSTNEDEDEDDTRVDLENFNPGKLIEETIETLSIHKERFNGIIMNLKKSKYINEDNKTDTIGLEDYFRTIDIEGIQKIDKILNYQSEMINYPRSINYYQSRLDKKGRDILEKLLTNQEKALQFVYYYEMCYSIRNLYRQVRRVLSNMYKFINNIDEDKINSTSSVSKQQFEDASTSIKNTIQECDLILDDFIKLENYIQNFE